ncbi:MAG TPA: response regulator [Bacteroidia bacterium]|jgi:CRP-like cAMP-binding protein/CheY-like chemotaxis protein|nr:response regulator [Bacteroidia bacterium]
MKKILLIEDNQEMRENTAEILELAKYRVLTAANGKEGVRLAQSESPDLIICDIMMPELDGYGVLHMLSKIEQTASIPFIFLTAKAEKTDQRRGMEMGADDYLTKPFDDMELLGAVEVRLKKSEQLRTKYERSMEGLDNFLNEVKQPGDLMKLSERKKVRTFKKKEVIYQEGAFPSAIFFLVKGKIKTSKINDDGKEFITALISEGEFFGYSALLEEQAYTDSAVAMDESEVCIIPKEDFFSLLYSSREVSSAFIRFLTNDIKEKEERLIKLAYNSVRKRVAEALLLLRERFAGEKKDPFSMAISREDLANLAGTAQETVIRTLSDFKEERIVDVKGSNITILEAGKLEKMKN